MIRIQLLDPESHRLVGIIWTDTIDYAEQSELATGLPALVHTPTGDSYCLLPQS